MTVSTCDSANYDSKLSAYTGSCGNLTLIGCGEDECGTQSSMKFAVAAGVPVLIRAGGYTNFAVGSSTLNLSQTVSSSGMSGMVGARPARRVADGNRAFLAWLTQCDGFDCAANVLRSRSTRVHSSPPESAAKRQAAR